MPLWLDLLRTPMAAPETAGLRVLRYSWQGLCLASAVVVGFFGQLHRTWGQPSAIAAAVLLLLTVVVTVLYILRKHRADTAFLETIGARE